MPGGELPFTDYFANLIVSESAWLGQAPSRLAKGERERLLQPHNGVAWLAPDAAPRLATGLAGAGEWTHQYGNPANTSNSGDTLVHSDLVLQWFGGPGAAPMVDRHLRAPAPLAAEGKLIIPGENLLIAVDAYNGTELWRITRDTGRVVPTVTTAWHGMVYGYTDNGPVVLDGRTGADHPTPSPDAPILVNGYFAITAAPAATPEQRPNYRHPSTLVARPTVG